MYVYKSEAYTYTVPDSSYYPEDITCMWYQFDTHLFYFRFSGQPIEQVSVTLTASQILTGVPAELNGLSVEGIGKIRDWVREVDKSRGR